MESGLRLRHAGDGHWGGAVLALPGAGKGSRGEPGGFREGLLLQGPPLSGWGGSGAATGRVAPGGERRAPLPGNGSDPRRAPGGGGATPASLEGAAGGVGFAHPGLRGPHRNGDARRPCLLDAAGGDQHARDFVLVRGPGAHRGRPARSGASPQVRSPRGLDAGGAPRGSGGGGIGYAWQALSEKATAAGFGRAGFALSDRDRASPAAAVAGGSGSLARGPAAPRSGGFTAGDAGGAQRGGLQCYLRGELPATLTGFPGGYTVKRYDRRRRCGNVGIRRLGPDFQARREGWKTRRGSFPRFPRRVISTATLSPLPRRVWKGEPHPRWRRFWLRVRSQGEKLFSQEVKS